MRVLRARNINGLFYEGMHLLDEAGVREDSRAGKVLVVPYPVMSVYEKPMERVLFDKKRDANPLFHLMEGLWMLAGRNDAGFLNRYITDFGSRFAESASGKPGAEASGVIHDAYGKRWRSAFGYDQLDQIVNRLRSNPTDRQAVLQMWDMTNWDSTFLQARPHFVSQNDLMGDWKTRPCNTHAYFRVRMQMPEERDAAGGAEPFPVLDMTICCRSNDAVWGCHGANAVHFSMLQEYMAGRIGVGVGVMYQLSSNYHGYEDTLAKIGDPVHLEGDDPYENDEVQAMPMATNWEAWDEDLQQFMEWHDYDGFPGVDKEYRNDWFRTVACRVALARWQWTNGMKPGARKMAEQIAAPDWRRACLEWMDRRKK